MFSRHVWIVYGYHFTFKTVYLTKRVPLADSFEVASVVIYFFYSILIPDIANLSLEFFIRWV